MQLEIALFYYPTKVAIVDVCSRFLSSICLSRLQDDTFRIFDNVGNALSEINADCVGVALNNFGWNMQDGTISVIAVDYDMPKLNGIEFCKQLRDPNIKKILITSQPFSREMDMAVRDGVVHACLHKGDANFVQQLFRCIKRFQAEYFRSKSEACMAVCLHQMPYLYDPALADYFDDVCDGLEVVKYSYDPQTSGFILMQKNGIRSVLLIHRQDALNEQEILSRIPRHLLREKNQSGVHVEKVTGAHAYWCLLVENIHDRYVAQACGVVTRVLH